MKKTSDIWFITYLVKMGHNFTDYELDYKNRIIAVFSFDDETWKKLRMEYNRSEMFEIRNIVMKIKALGETK